MRAWLRRVLERVFPDRHPLGAPTLPPIDQGGTLFAAVWECPTRAACDADKNLLAREIARLEAENARLRTRHVGE